MNTIKPGQIGSTAIEVKVAEHFGYRANIIVPNISWGAGLHECDLLIINNKSRYATEVEIKISKSDLKADLLKPHHHSSKRIKYLYFAVPDYLLDAAISLLPDTTGIIVISKGSYNNSGFHQSPEIVYFLRSEVYRRAKANKDSRPMTQEEVINICRLGCMRIWPLKHSVTNNYHTRQRKIQKQKDQLLTQPTLF